jgi:hypothetical protein
MRENQSISGTVSLSLLCGECGYPLTYLADRPGEGAGESREDLGVTIRIEPCPQCRRRWSRCSAALIEAIDAARLMVARRDLEK